MSTNEIKFNHKDYSKSLYSTREKTIKPLIILIDFDNNSPVDNHQYSRNQFSALLFGGHRVTEYDVTFSASS